MTHINECNECVNWYWNITTIILHLLYVPVSLLMQIARNVLFQGSAINPIPNDTLKWVQTICCFAARVLPIPLHFAPRWRRHSQLFERGTSSWGISSREEACSTCMTKCLYMHSFLIKSNWYENFEKPNYRGFYRFLFFYLLMSVSHTVLNPEEPLLSSDEEDDDFEPGFVLVSQVINRSSCYRRRTVCHNEEWQGRKSRPTNRARWCRCFTEAKGTADIRGVRARKRERWRNNSK